MALSVVGIRLHVDDGGAEKGGLPVLFLHSLAGHGGHWQAQLDYLRPFRRAVAVDWRGHGRSPAPAGSEFDIPTLAADIAATVTAIGLKRFVLVGHSLGAAVALEVAASHPAQVAGLLLVDPSGDFRQVPEEMIAPFFAGLEGDAYTPTIEGYWQSVMVGGDTAVQTRLLADLRATPRETVVGALRALRQYDPLPALQRYPRPMRTVITPANDDPSSLHRLYPQLPVTRVEGVGHWLQMDNPEAFNMILDDFLQQVA